MGEEAAAEEKEDELTEEEKKLWFVKRDCPDLVEDKLAKTFASFSLPDDAEGFDEIRYAWQAAPQCAVHLKEWMLELKKKLPAEELEPSAWFKERWTEWQRVLKEWRKKQTDAKEDARTKKPAPP